jgi:hypothetical protein
MVSRDACAPVKCAGGVAILTIEWLSPGNSAYASRQSARSSLSTLPCAKAGPLQDEPASGSLRGPLARRRNIPRSGGSRDRR